MTGKLGGLVAVILLAGSVLAAGSGLADHTGASVARVPVLAELFTSEGCSSCPPADELLRQLLREQPVDGVEVIALSEHVDYWNRLGWRDPFSSEQFTQRQSDYARAMATAQIYTPQLVINGTIEVIGNDAHAVKDALARGALLPRAHLVVSSQPVDQGISVKVVISDAPVLTGSGPIEVVVAVAEDGLVSDVSRGENARRRLSHDAVVRRLAPIGTLLPGRHSGEFVRAMEAPDRGTGSALRLVAFLQDRKTRRVLGVATSPL